MRRSGRWLALGIALIVGGIACAPVAPPPPEPEPLVAEQVVVEKAKHRLYLIQHGRVVREYRVALGRDPLGPKCATGDGRTPEGLGNV